MPRTVHRFMKFDCAAGISGDMIVAALVDLLESMGKDVFALFKVARAVETSCESVSRVNLKVHDVQKGGFAAKHLGLDIKEDNRHAHVHDMELALTRCIGELGLVSSGARDFATNVFQTLLAAENQAHGIHDDGHSHVHLHELASADTLVDILSVSMALDMLGFFDPSAGTLRVHASPVAVGRGTITIAHGTVPVPAPGTLAIIQKYHIPIQDGPVEGELATPTGLALLAAMNPDFSLIPGPARVVATGTGAGTREFPGLPNILRVQLLDVEMPREHTPAVENVINGVISNSVLELSADEIVQLSMYIDDASPEDIGFLIRTSYDLGAREVINMAVQGKKSRQGTEIHVLCDDTTAQAIALHWLENSTTIGCRVQVIGRVVIARELIEVPITIEHGSRAFSGTVRVKVLRQKHHGTTGTKSKRPLAKVEHDDLERVASELGISIHEARALVEPKVALHTRGL